MVYESECWALNKKENSEIKVAKILEADVWCDWVAQS